MSLDIDILRNVQKPARYIGGEVNQIKKDLSKVETRVGLCYPDTYEVGMSHIGLKILYEVLNRDPTLAAERVYAPWTDYEAELRARGQALTTLENRIPLSELHVLGFTLQYELSYSNLVNILELGGIPRRAQDRDVDDTVVIGGGSSAFNPEPLAPIMDCICLGDGEEIIREVVDAVMLSKKKRESRLDLWIRLSEIQGCYVPQLYDVRFNPDGTIAEVVAKHGAPKRVRKRILVDLDKAPYFTDDIVPNTQIVHDRYGVEVQRGCMRGCRFCQAGYVYRPERQRSPERVRQLVRDGIKSTGVSEYGMLSLSLGDYNCIEPLLLSLMDEHAERSASISTPSMRLESVTPTIMDQIARVRRGGFTVAPEAGSHRMRGVINKVIDEDVLFEMVGQLFSKGWRILKLYFMLGLPTEQIEDLQAIVDLGRKCRRIALKHCSNPTITVSVSSFVPKSHTPFQWSPQITLDEIREKQRFLLRETKRAKLNYRNHEATSSIMEGVFSRGDRRIGEVLLRAQELGARMDGWQEHHDLGIWDQALADNGLKREWFNHRRRDMLEILPWDHIDSGVKKEWLWEDWMSSLDAGRVDDCSESPCYDCGVCDHKVVHNRVFTKDEPGAKPRHRQRKKYIARSIDELGLVQLGSINLKDREKPATETAPDTEMVDAPKPAPDWSKVYDVSLPSEHRLRFRLRFAKRALQALNGNHEIISQFQRALKRAEVPVLFSKGMHPRMKTALSPPVPLGTWSEAEFADVEVKAPFGAEEMFERLKGQLPEGLILLDVEEVPRKAESLAQAILWARWSVEAPEEYPLAERVAWYETDAPRIIETTTKGRTRKLDVRAQIRNVRVQGRTLEVDVRVRDGGKLRSVLESLVGSDPLTPGWRATKLDVEMAPHTPESGAEGSSDPAMAVPPDDACAPSRSPSASPH